MVLNLADHGYKVCVFNRTVSKVGHFLDNEAKDHKNITGAQSIKELCDSLASPRKIMLMVMAGKPVDDFIQQIVPHLEAGDILIDGGNSHFGDTARRCEELEARGIHFVGCGVSGGEEGARYGPSMMPGGSEKAWYINTARLS